MIISVFCYDDRKLKIQGQSRKREEVDSVVAQEKSNPSGKLSHKDLEDIILAAAVALAVLIQMRKLRFQSSFD